MDTDTPQLLDLSTVLVNASERYNIEMEQLYISALSGVISSWPAGGLKWPMIVIDIRSDPPAGTVVEGLALGVDFSDLTANYLRDDLQADSRDGTNIEQIISNGIAESVGKLLLDGSSDAANWLLALLRLYDHAHGLSAHRSLAAAAAVDRGALILLFVGWECWDLAVCDGEGELERREVVC